MSGRLVKRLENLTALGDGGISPAINVADYKIITFELIGASTSALTVKIQQAGGIDAPDFTAAASDSNPWDYLEAIDTEDGSAIDGDTGVVFADDGVRRFTANISGLDWISFVVTSHTTGTVKPKVFAYSNE